MAKVATVLEISATVTERGQTTVPAAIREISADGTCLVQGHGGRDRRHPDKRIIGSTASNSRERHEMPPRAV